MSMVGTHRVVGDAGSQATLTTTGDKFTFTPATPVEIIRWGIVVSAGFGGTPVFAADQRITAGSDTGRINAAFGTITPGAAAVGTVVYHDVDPLTETTVLNPGDQLIIEATTAATTTGSGFPFVVVRDLPFATAGDASIASATEFNS